MIFFVLSVLFLFVSLRKIKVEFFPNSLQAWGSNLFTRAVPHLGGPILAK